nr:hypothetical protein [Tanacetum cinerariifolium]
MALKFADTHNMIAHLTKSDATEGFKQILDFLNASVIIYALTVNPTIYVSCIKQFWSSFSVKKVNDVIRLQALINRKKVIITEDIVREALYLDDTKSIDCLPNEEIFAELAMMGYVKPSTKHTFYKAFFSAQWKFLIPFFNQTADDVADVVAADVATHADIEPTPPSPTPTTPPPPLQELPFTSQEDASKQEGIIDLIDADEDVTLEEVDTAKVLSMQNDEPEPAELKEQAQIEQDEAYERVLEAELNKNINWDDVIEQVKRKEKEDNVVLRYQALKRKPQTEAQARKNMVVYLKSMAGFKMDYFKGMSYDAIHPIFKKYFNSNVAFLEKSKEELEEEESRALKRKSKSSKEKSAKKQKLDEEVEELKKHLQIIPNYEDDVYIEATPLALKVPVADYEIHIENNKPYYKIIRADGTHQLFLSFFSLLRNFDREDLEVLWQIVQDRFTSSKPKNFSNDFLLTKLKSMFEKPNVEAQVWKNQRGIHDDLAGREKISIDKTVVATSSTEAEYVAAASCCAQEKGNITEDTVREDLYQDDAESIDCLPNEEIFAELARMG